MTFPRRGLTDPPRIDPLAQIHMVQVQSNSPRTEKTQHATWNNTLKKQEKKIIQTPRQKNSQTYPNYTQLQSRLPRS